MTPAFSQQSEVKARFIQPHVYTSPCDHILRARAIPPWQCESFKDPSLPTSKTAGRMRFRLSLLIHRRKMRSIDGRWSRRSRSGSIWGLEAIATRLEAIAISNFKKDTNVYIIIEMILGWTVQLPIGRSMSTETKAFGVRVSPSK